MVIAHLSLYELNTRASIVSAGVDMMQVTKAIKLALYACLCINGYNMKTKRPTGKL